MKKILLAEDDNSMVGLLKIILRMEGYHAININEDEQDIIKLAQEEKPDLILMDVHIGDQNGLDVIKELRCHIGIDKTKVIMTSGMDLKEDCEKAGADDFVQKPFMPEELLQKINNLLVI
jgi:DNA-binding response OmpR family regulator